MRKARKLMHGAAYHVIARTNRKELLLEPKLAKRLFLEILVRAKGKYDFRIDNFVIMGNHFHLLIRPMNDSDLGAIMKWIMGVYTMTYNRVYETCGHLWGSRFYSRPIDSFSEYVKVFNYIDQNPVKANLVSRPDEWEWSGIRHHQTGCQGVVTKPCVWMELVFSGHQLRGLSLP